MMSYHLIAGGIAADRLEAKGYGETRPVVVTRRIHKEYERQEVCNALNRRTEFKVLRTTYNLYEE